MVKLLTQETLDKSHDALDKLIKVSGKAAIEACNEGETGARDTLFKVQAHLLMAKAEAGSLEIGEIRPRSGGK